jgi:hypothetical protein
MNANDGQVPCAVCQSGFLSAVTNLHQADFQLRFSYRDQKGREQTADYHVMRARVCLSCGTVFPMLGAKNLARLKEAYRLLTPIENTSER